MDGSDEQEGVCLNRISLRKETTTLSLFLTEQDIPKDYYDRFSWLQIPFTDCLFYCRKDRKVSSERDCSRCIL